ncbi:MAG: FtsX-like permease family protein, partial [Bacteroidota bacterium]
FEPMNGMWLNSRHVRNFPFGFTEKVAIYFLVCVGSVLLLLACFNYINIALATASTRLKEISVRKVMGSSRPQIIWQFLTENLLICLLATILGIGLANYLFLPWFNELLDGLDLSVSFMEKPHYWLFCLGLMLVAAVGGAGYPALYISKLNPNTILKKDFKLGNKPFFRKLLIGCQLGLTVIAIYMTFSFLIYSQQQKAKEWGYNQHDLLVVNLADAKDFDSFKNDVLTNPNVLEVTGSKERMGVYTTPVKIDVAGEAYNIQSLHIDDNYLPTYGIKLLDGRNFSPHSEADQLQSVIVNETFKKKMNWAQAVGQNFKINQQNYHVVGEVKDFHYESFYFEVKPLVIQLADAADLTQVSIRTKAGTTTATAKELNQNWQKIYPNIPYNYAFQDQAFFVYFDVFRQANGLMRATAFLTMLLSIVGFFGLAMLLINQKMKELSIRKILGAGSFHLSQLINKEFAAPFLGALLIGLPVAILVTKNLAHVVSSADTMFNPLPLFLTIFSVCLMLAVSLGKHIYTAIFSEPSSFLRDE